MSTGLSIWSKIANAYRAGSLVRKAKTRILADIYQYLGLAAANRFFCRRVWTRIEPRKIVFSNFRGNGYGCNPKYICEELLRRNLGLDIVWLVKADMADTPFPPGIRLVRWESRRARRELATAHIWVDNQRKNHFIQTGFVKKPGQVYIQTFHGAIGIKTCGADMIKPGHEKSHSAVSSRLDADMIDFLISNSDYETNMYKTSFFGKGKTMLFGHPRNDIFFNPDADGIRSRTLAALGLPGDKKYILYAPTYRDSLRIDCYDIDYRGMVAALEERFGGEWKVLVRLHPTVRMIPELKPPADIAIDVCNHPDIQELMVAADAMVTDYSSCIFDYLLSGKPGFVFAVDLEKQTRERGFYYPLETTPFPIGLNSAELCANIRAFDAEKFAADTKAFLASKGCMEDGKASARVADLIESELARQR